MAIMTLFRADRSPHKVDLSVGVYQDETGRTPVLRSVQQAEGAVLAAQDTKAYVEIAGNSGFIEGMEKLVFGVNHPAGLDGRIATIQTAGGSGAISAAAHLINLAKPGARVHLSEPTWANHVPLLTFAGLQVERYPYYDRSTRGIDFEAMLDAVEQIPSGDALVLHACCHNPCGADLSEEQWKVLADVCVRGGVFPLIDFAYQGLAAGLEDDAFGVRHMAERVPELVVVASCSKNMGLYRERVGSVSVVAPDAGQRRVVMSNLTNIARSLYSMPPDHGASIVARVLQETELKMLWESELAEMRSRLTHLRQLLASALHDCRAPIDFSFIARQRGMFSLLGITKDQIVRLRDEFHVYMLESGRVNVAGISSSNVGHVANAIATVLGS